MVVAVLVLGVLVAIGANPSGESTPGATGNSSGVAVDAPSGAEEVDARILRWLLRWRWWQQTPEQPAKPELWNLSYDRLTASWMRPESAVFEITDYDVQYRAADRPTFLDLAYHGNATEATITGLVEGTEYFVRVRAVNEMGEGDWSPAASGKTREHLDPAERVFRRMVSTVVQSACVHCHVKGGVADQTRLVFVATAQPHHEAMNLRVFETFLSGVEGDAESILDKIQDETHGGGVQVESGTDEFAAIEQLLALLAEHVAADDGLGVFVYRLVGEDVFSLAGLTAANAGDTNGDGLDELIVGSENFEDPRNPAWVPGKAYLVSGRDLVAADRAGGRRNRVISLGDLAGQRYSWTIDGNERSDDLVGSAMAAAGDHTGDGLGDVWVGARGRGDFAGEVYLVSQSVVAAMEESNRQIDLARVSARSRTWVLVGEASYDNAGRSIASADIDGDGYPDAVVGAPFHGGGAVYVISGKSLPAADAVDGEVDRRVGLGAIAAQANSWKLLSEGEDDLLGIQVAGTGDMDGDGREDFLIAATGLSRSAVYLVAAASLESADAADGASDGVVQMGRVADGTISWKLVGEPGRHREGRILAANDLDGDGEVELLMGSWRDDGDANAYILTISDLPAADIADGATDGVVEMERAAMEAGSYRLTGGVGYYLSVASTDFDGDDRADVIVGAPGWDGGARLRPSPTEVYTPGAVYLVSGTDLPAAADESGTIDLEEVAALPKSWKVVGESGKASDGLGGSVGVAGDLNGDGVDELAFGNPRQVVPYLDTGVGGGPGGVVVLSGMDLAVADSKDGIEDGVVHLNSLNISHLGGEFPEPSIVEEYDDHVVVMHVPGAWSRINGLRFDYFARLLLTEYEDVFDYMMFVSNLSLSDTRYYYAGSFGHVSNADRGVGVSIADRMAENRLRGFIHFTFLGALESVGAHEVMHSWANFVFDVNYRPHWGFSSADGQLGGFDRDRLADLGNRRFAAGNFSPTGNVVPYSPLELYLAGWIPPDEVPEVWVARDGLWTGERDRGSPVFWASETEMWTVERLVEEYGVRIPTHENSQRTFRAAAILMVDEEHPHTDAVLAEFAEEVRRFAHPGNDDHATINFWEATGGRASISMGDLSKVRRDRSTVSQRTGAQRAVRRARAVSEQWRVLPKGMSLCPELEPPVGHLDDTPGHYPPQTRK